LKRIIVCLKQAVDVTQLKVDPATRQLITASTPRKMSDFDKNALEEAVRVREKNAGVEVVTVTVASEEAKTVLREALAMGADKAYVVFEPSLQDVDTLGTAHILAETIKKIGEYNLVLCGESSLDSFSGLVGSRVEESVETVKAKLPALVTVTREINQPRIPSLMMIMKASKKEIVMWTLADLGVDKEKLASKIEVVEVLAPKTERKRIRITGENAAEIADKLAKALIQEGVVKR